MTGAIGEYGPALVALALTVATEVLLARPMLPRRDSSALLVVGLVQAITNPLLNLALSATGWSLARVLASLPASLPEGASIICLEVVVVLAEAALYRFAGVFRHPLAASLTLNLASFSLGVALTAAGIL